MEQHFGNAQKIASAYMEKAFLWPPIKSKDVKALQAYSLCLSKNKLNLRGGKTGIILRTMGQEKIVQSYVVSGLEVGGVDGKNL